MRLRVPAVDIVAVNKIAEGTRQLTRAEWSRPV